MPKTIKISEETYDDLDRFRDKGETFDDAVAKLLKVANLAEQMSVEVLQPGGGLRS